MTVSVAELSERLAAAEALPFGRGRTLEVEEVAREADGSVGPGAHRLWILSRTALMSAYNFGGEHSKVFTPFAAALARLDAHPAEVDDDLMYRVLWQYKWAVQKMIEYPQVSTERIAAALDDMEQRYRAYGEGLAPVLGMRALASLAIDGPAAAADPYERWVTSPRTRLSDCHACEPTTRALFLVRAGRDEDALDVLKPVLLGEATCEEQPRNAQSTALLPLVRSGRFDEARDAHVRSYRILRTRPAGTTQRADHIEFLALTGNEARGLDVLEESLPRLDAAVTPEDRLRLLAAAALLLKRLDEGGHGRLEVQTAPGSVIPVESLRTALTDEAVAIAVAFDDRNGTTTVSDAVRATLALSPFAEVGLDGMTRARAVLASDPASSTPQVQEDQSRVQPAPLPSDVSLLAAELDRAWQHGTSTEVDDVVDHYAGIRQGALIGAAEPHAEPGFRLAVSRLESARARDQRSSASAAERIRDLHAAADLARSAGFPADADLHLLAAQVVAARAGDEPEAGGLRLLTDALAQGGTAEERARGAQRVALAHLALGADQAARQALTDGLGVVSLEGSDEERGIWAGLTLLLAQVDAQSGDTDQAQRLAEAVLAVATADHRPMLEAQASHLIARLASDPDVAVDLLEHAEDLARRAGLLEIAVDAACVRGRFLAWGSDPARGARVLGAVVSEVDRRLGEVSGAGTRLDLAVALRRLDRPAEAAEVAETGLLMLDEGVADGLRGALGLHASAASGDLGEHERALALAAGAASDLETVGLWEDVAESRRLAALAAEATDDPSGAAVHWEAMAHAAEQAARPDLRMVALRSRPLALIAAGDGSAAGVAIEHAARELQASGLPDEHLRWEDAQLDVQRARIALLEGRPADAVAPAGRALGAFTDLGDTANERTAAYLAARAYESMGDLGSCLAVLKEGADRAVAGDDPEGARLLGAELAQALDRAGRPDEADAVWATYSGETGA